MKRTTRIITCLTMLTQASLLNSAEPSEPDWYQVEVIIFSQQDFYNAETPRRDIELVYPDNWVTLKEPLQPNDSEMEESTNGLTQLSAIMHNQTELEEAQAPAEEPFVRLTEEMRSLNPDTYTLSRAPGYRILLHQSWRQPMENRKRAPWILIKGGEQYGDHFELEGSLRLYQSRYLHFQSNLWKARYQPMPVNLDPEPEEQQKPWPVIPDAPQPLPEEVTDVEQLTINVEKREPFSRFNKPEPIHFAIEELVTLRQSRKLTLNQLHYLDHPNMGILVLVKAVEMENEE